MHYSGSSGAHTLPAPIIMHTFSPQLISSDVVHVFKVWLADEMFLETSFLGASLFD